MPLSEVREGSCVCKAIRYRVTGNPMRVSVCHCTFCQRRTGSAFAILAVLKEDQVELRGDTLSVFEHRAPHRERRYDQDNQCQAGDPTRAEVL